MINIPIDWKVFECKFSQNPRGAFENLTTILFCYEMNQPYGVFRYFNQPYIETHPVTTPDGLVTGFQTKYYDAGTSLSSKEAEFKDAITGAKRKYTDINRILLYVNRELSASSRKDTEKPIYQKNIEKCGEDLGIKIEWRVLGNIEQILLELPNVRDLYFNPQPGLSRYMELIQRRKSSVLANIHSDIPYHGQTIKIRQGTQALHDFLNSDRAICIVYGEAGTGKSGIVKDLIRERQERDSTFNFFMFAVTDLDVKEDTLFLRQYGEYQLEDALSLYGQDELKVCMIESAEKFFTLNNPQVFESLVRKFMEYGWKMIFTIRTAYKTNFCSIVLDGIPYDEVQINCIGDNLLAILSKQNGFHLPENQKLRQLLCDLFYLKLYLKLEPSSLDEVTTSERFVEQVWKEVICNDTHRAHNLPVRRQQLAVNIVFKMLQQETDIYRSGADDDPEALEALEESGVIAVYDNSPQKWMMSHDVYEELIVKHILTDRYQSRTPVEKFLEGFGTSLRARKLYRIWLETLFAQGEKQSAEFFISIIQGPVEQAWKDETLIALMQSGSEDSLLILDAMMSWEQYTLFTRTAFLLNTACRNVNQALLKKLPEFSGNKYRFTEPLGIAWHTIFKFIYDNRSLIPWTKQNLNITADILKSWTEKYEAGETTRLAGRIALYLKSKSWCESRYPHTLQKDSQFITLNTVILAAALELKQELGEIFNAMIKAGEYDRHDENFLLVKKSLSNIFDCGKAYQALPSGMILLAEGYWHRSEKGRKFYERDSMEACFGLNDTVQWEYKAESAYQTPLYRMLWVKPRETLNFILRLMNDATDCYEKSDLNQDYHETSEIAVKISDQETIKQICSDRLWKMHRGTHVAPKLLESVLMALEKWLLDVVEQVEAETASLYCKFLLRQSKTAAITAVVLSVVAAYPDKLFEISCILLKTKEIFVLDISRLSAEHNAGFLKGALGSNQLYDDERIQSNALPFRKVLFEDILIGYQLKLAELPEEVRRERLNRLYSAFDEATVGIDAWDEIFQYAYYRCDLRRCEVSGGKISQGELQITLTSKMPENLVERSKTNEKEHEQLLRHTPLLLWAGARLRHNQDAAQKYPQFESGPTPIIQEVKQILQEDGEEFHFQDVSTAINACSVLLRDESASMSEEETALCAEIIQAACFRLVAQRSPYQCGDGTEAAIPALARLASLNNLSADWTNPLFLLLALVMNPGRERGIVLDSVANILWDSERTTAWILIRAYAELAPQFCGEVFRYDGVSTKQFFEYNSKKIEKLLQDEISDFNSIPIDGLNINQLIDLQRMVNSKDDGTAFEFVLKIGDKIWGTLFGKDDTEELERRDYEAEYGYMQWLGDYVLNLSEERQCDLLDCLAGKLKYDQEFSRFLREIISAEDRSPRYAAFWSFWDLLKNHIFSECKRNKKQSDAQERETPIGYGLGSVLVEFLLACADWKGDAKSWHSLREDSVLFYKTVANQIGYHPAVLYAISKVLNTIGSNVLFDEGVELLSDIVNNNPKLREASLPVNTLYYVEEYMYHYVKRRIYLFKSDVHCKRQVLNVLDFLVDRGSTSGFLLREEII